MARRQADRAGDPADLSRQGVSAKGAHPSRETLVAIERLLSIALDTENTGVRVTAMQAAHGIVLTELGDQ